MRRLGTLTCFILLFCTASAPAQPRVPFGQGSHALRHILRKLNLQPLSDFSQISDPSDTLVIVLGETEPLSQLPRGVAGFLEDGGALLVATDRKAIGFEKAGVAGALINTSSPEQAYRGLPDCPLVTAFDPHHPLFQGVRQRQLATNLPSYLVEREVVKGKEKGSQRLGDLLILAWFSDGNKLFPFAAGKTWRGNRNGARDPRLLLLADHSVFINDMMLQKDNDNFVFAYNCVEWLAQPGPRGRVLLVEEGTMVANFDVPLKDTDLPDIPLPPLEVVNKLLANLEDENVFNKLLISGLGAGDAHPLEKARRVMMQGWVISLTIALLVFGFYWLSRSRFHQDKEASVLTMALPRSGVIEQRHQAMLQDGNLWEAAREEARQCFVALGHGEAADAFSPPSVTVTGNWWRRWVLSNQIRWLWRLAHGKTPRTISPRDFNKVTRQSSEVQSALADGTLRWT